MQTINLWLQQEPAVAELDYTLINSAKNVCLAIQIALLALGRLQTIALIVCPIRKRILDLAASVYGTLMKTLYRGDVLVAMQVAVNVRDPMLQIVQLVLTH